MTGGQPAISTSRQAAAAPGGADVEGADTQTWVINKPSTLLYKKNPKLIVLDTIFHQLPQQLAKNYTALYL